MTARTSFLSRPGKAGAGAFTAAALVLFGCCAGAPLLLTLAVASGAGLLVAGGVAAAAVPLVVVGAWRLRRRRAVPGLKRDAARAPVAAGPSPVAVGDDGRKEVSA